MVSEELALTTVGIIANAISLLMFLSPMPTFIQIVKKGSVELFSPVPYFLTVLNYGIWLLYGLPRVHPQSLQYFTTNCAGLLISVVYMFLFMFYCEDMKRSKLLHLMFADVLTLGVLIVLVETFSHAHVLSPTTLSNIIGTMAIMSSIMMYAAPLSVMDLVIMTKSVEYMPFFPSFFLMLNGISWTIYGFISSDPYIAIPNGLGSVLGISQLILYATFYKSTQRQLAERKAVLKTGLADMGQSEGTLNKSDAVGDEDT